MRHGKRPASERLLAALRAYSDSQKPARVDYLPLFLQSRQALGLTGGTMRFYRQKLVPYAAEYEPARATAQDIERFLLKFPNLGNRHLFFQALKTFYRWLEQAYGLPNPMRGMKAPLVPKLILPSLERAQVLELIDAAETPRDRAIIALFAESGLRLSELKNVKAQDIDWSNRTIRTMGKGRKEALAPFGELSERYLKQWLAHYRPNGNIWGMNKAGITTMLRRLEVKTGLPCNAHTFRRTFACLLRKAGVDNLVIRDLGRWNSVAMVERYTRSFTFQDALKFYKAPLS